MRTKISILLLCFFAFTSLYAQKTFQIKGRVINKESRENLEFVNVLVEGTTIGSATDSLGQFTLRGIKAGTYRLRVSFIGFKTLVTPEYNLSSKDLVIEVELEEKSNRLNDVVISASSFRKDVEMPLGLKIIGIQEIEKSPGANRDISKIVQSYPGVSYSPRGFRNDLIVRGGGPSENRFFLDDIEIPNINHFSTQGASGGPVGIVNADLIREVKFYTGALPNDKSSGLSSVLDFKLKEGNLGKPINKATLGASEISLAGNGHWGKNTSYVYSVRQSYLQFLFKFLDLPFLPTFTDGLFKVKTRINKKNELTFLALTGIDRLRLNDEVEGEDEEFILGYMPRIDQLTFTLGGVYRHYSKHGVDEVVLSHSYLKNKNLKYQDNDESDPANLMLRMRSVDQETKLRLETSKRLGKWKYTSGLSFNYVQYNNNTFQRRFFNDFIIEDYRTNLDYLAGALYLRSTYESLDEDFSFNAGIRFDASTLSSNVNKPWKQFSPSFSISRKVASNLFASASSSITRQLPYSISLAYRDSVGNEVNKSLKYMMAWQNSLGLSWRPNKAMELTVEAFYKKYTHVPFSVNDGVPLTCKGNDYFTIGNEELISESEGHSYGLELMYRWVIANRLNLTSSFTLFKSEYEKSPQDDNLIASSWDNRFLFYCGGTYELPRNWSVGVKVNAIGGAPYTPYDEDKSSLVQAWNAQRRPYLDYSKYNEERFSAYAQLDLRIDKIYYLKGSKLGFYIDIQNITGSKFDEPDVLTSTGVIQNPSAPIEEQRYVMKTIEQGSGTVLPTIGITFEW